MKNQNNSVFLSLLLLTKNSYIWGILSGNANLYYMPMITVINIQKDLSTRTNVIEQKPFCVQMDNYSNDVRPITYM